MSSAAHATTAQVESKPEDERLMRLVAQGNPHARRVLLTRIAPRVQRVCLAVLGQPADADDAAQLTLLDVLDAARTFEGRGSLERWAERIAARKAVRYAAREARRRKRFEPGLDDAAIAAPSTDQPLSDRVPRKILEYLRTLPQPRRDVLVLKHVLGYSVPEIASLIGIPEGTVKDRLVAARKQIRKAIARDGTVASSPARRSKDA